MTLPTLLPLISAIFVFLLGIFVLFKNPRAQLNFIFFLHALSITIWLFGTFMMFLNKDNKELAIFWDRFVYIGVVFIPAFMYHFGLVITRKNKNAFLFLAYFLSLFFLIISRTDYFVKNLFYYEWGVHTKAQFFHHLFLIYFFAYVISWFFIVYKYYKKTSGFVKYQIKYFFIAFLLLFTIGPLAYLPAYGIGIYPFSYLSGVIFVTILAYAIIRYRLMDIRFVLGQTFIYLFSFVTVVVLALGWMYLYQKLEIEISYPIFSSLILILSIILFQWFFRFFEIIASRYFYYTFYSYQKVLFDTGKKLVQILNIQELSFLLVNTLMNTMKLDRTVILFREDNGNYQILKNTGFKEENGISLVRDNFLTEYLEKTKKTLVYEELSLFVRDAKDEWEKEKFSNLQANMKRIEASLCLPLFRENKITGLIVLGNKISKEPYSEQDIELLTILSNQASIALENARLYNEIQDLSQTLQQRVDEQTKEIKRAYEVEKKGRKLEERARKDLQRLNEAKSQFMLATQHHLRTPLTSMYGYLDLLLGGTYGKISNKVREILGKFQKSTKNEIKIVEELLNISKFQLGEDVVLLQSGVDAENILNEIIEDLKSEAEQKGIYLKMEKPDNLPKIKADQSKLKIALSNIVDNAVKYTKKGGVIVKLETIDSQLRIITKDTGIGINKEEIKNLFVRIFERSKTAQKMFTTGRGIGLFISAKIIEGHRGRIWADSEGLGKGSTFFVELPIG